MCTRLIARALDSMHENLGSRDGLAEIRKAAFLFVAQVYASSKASGKASSKLGEVQGLQRSAGPHFSSSRRYEIVVKVVVKLGAGLAEIRRAAFLLAVQGLPPLFSLYIGLVSSIVV